MADLAETPEGVFSLLDTDLYKLTMQCAILKSFPNTEVEYAFTNRTPHMRLSRDAFEWLRDQVEKLGRTAITEPELDYLRQQCPYLGQSYLNYISSFRMRPKDQVVLDFAPTTADPLHGDIHIAIKGLWVETISYEIPLLALTSEAYFRFCDRDWNHDGQEEQAFQKGIKLARHGCLVSDFGSRRRRDYRTQDLALKGLCRASDEALRNSWKGKLSGTSNVHFAMKYGIPPVGTVAHEWFMGIAAITGDYVNANELALRYWVATFGKGVLAIALTDTFGTPTFFEAFKKSIPSLTKIPQGASANPRIEDTKAAISRDGNDVEAPSYAQIFTGVRQDSGDPANFIKITRDFYDSVGIKDQKTIVFSDSLNVDLCLEYKRLAEESGFQPSFGVGTFFTNDFVNRSNEQKSAPLNIVIKLSRAGGRPAIKLSDDMGKNMGDEEVVQEVKGLLGYIERSWENGDESHRWG